MSSSFWRGLLAAGIAASVFICSMPADAAPKNVSCTTSATSLNFGNYNPLSNAAVMIDSTISINCNATGKGPINYTIALSHGGSGSYAPRQLLSGAHRLNYNLYTDSTFSAVWGDGTGSSTTVAGQGNVTKNRHSFTNMTTVFGQIPGQQMNVVPGTYTDGLTVTVIY